VWPVWIEMLYAPPDLRKKTLADISEIWNVRRTRHALDRPDIRGQMLRVKRDLWRCDITNYLPRLASNWDSTGLSLPSTRIIGMSHQHPATIYEYSVYLNSWLLFLMPHFPWPILPLNVSF
jgi:hypothetical protein